MQENMRTDRVQCSGFLLTQVDMCTLMCGTVPLGMSCTVEMARENRTDLFMDFCHSFKVFSIVLSLKIDISTFKELSGILFAEKETFTWK